MRATGRKSRGAAVIEFAVLLPLLAIIVFGIIEFGFLWMQSFYIANSAREGARIAAKLSDVNAAASKTQIHNGVKNYLQGLYKNIEDAGTYSLTSPTVEIEVEEVTLPANPPAPAQNAVRVKVTAQTHEVWKPILWPLLAGLFGGEVILNQISESAVFVKEM